MKKAFLLCCFFALSASLPAQDLGLFQKKLFIVNQDTLRYRVLYPLHYKSHKKYPVITFLHGAGERGNDNELQLVHGATFFLNDTLRRKFKAIVIFPQLPTDSVWDYHVKTDPSNAKSYIFTYSPKQTIPSYLVISLLKKLIKDKIANRQQMYIGGLSFGGMGTFDMIERFPDFFTAAFPICGGGDTTKANIFAGKTAVWIFHGDADRAVDVSYSRAYYKTLKSLHADVRYSEYPGVDHNSWDNAFEEKNLLPWLFSKKKIAD
ncbi:MAG: phospholipase [Ginsengibacter sp.]